MLRPLGKNILVKKITEEKKGGLLLPDQYDKPYRATIIDFGSKVDLDIEKDDTLLLVPFSGSKISDADDGYLLVTERDILGVVIAA